MTDDDLRMRIAELGLEREAWNGDGVHAPRHMGVLSDAHLPLRHRLIAMSDSAHPNSRRATGASPTVDPNHPAWGYCRCGRMLDFKTAPMSLNVADAVIENYGALVSGANRGGRVWWIRYEAQ